MAFGPVFELSSLNGTNGFRIDSAVPGDMIGFPAGDAAGDVNGDGFADIIIGASYADPNGDRSGASYVVFGQAAFGSALNLGALDGTNGFQISGEAQFHRSGSTVAGAGDVNGDGFADVIVGAAQASPNGYFTGASYVVFGQAGRIAANADVTALDGNNGFRINGEAEFDFSGGVVSSAGDINGDGFDDVIVGADGAATTASNAGASYMVFGHAGGFPADLNVAALNGRNGLRINGEAAGDGSGIEVAAGGDVNGDGFDDVIVGAVNRGGFAEGPNGASYVVFGHAGGFNAEFNLANLNGRNGFRIIEEEGSFAGGAPASAGDINGDGFDDLVIGADSAGPNDERFGASYVVFGHAGGFPADLHVTSLDGSNGFKISGEASLDYSGRSVSLGGDINGDGFDDLIVGAPRADPNGAFSGASYVVFGRAGGFAANLDLSSLDGRTGFQINGEQANDLSGGSVAAAGDVNRDGFDDLVIAAQGADASYIVFGAATGPIARAGTAAGDSFTGGAFRDSLSGDAGDDHLRGAGGNDRLLGGEDRDVLAGGQGQDSLHGGAGADRLYGGKGTDRLVGGAGPDVFIFTSAGDSLAGSRRDVIDGFEPDRDRIDLRAIDADPDAAGDQAFALRPAFKGAGGQIVARQFDGNTIVSGDIDGDRTADFHIALTGLVTLAAADFLL